MLQHTLKTQLQIINATIAHVSNVQKIIERNEKTLRDTVVRIAQKYDDYAQQQELRNYFIELGGLLTELQFDAKSVIQYISDDHTKFAQFEIVSLEQIIQSLKDSNQFARDLQFPFVVILEDWLKFREFATINVYCKDSSIYTVVKFPLVTSESYSVFRIIPLPTHESGNVFATIQVRHRVIAVDTGRQTYSTLEESQWAQCKGV